MSFEGRQWLQRIEMRLARAYGNALGKCGSDSLEAPELLQAWRLVHTLRTTCKHCAVKKLLDDEARKVTNL
jgi:hypothetical protein